MMRGYLDGDRDTVERKHEVPLGDFHRHVETELEVLRKVENGDDFTLASSWIEELRTLAREAATQMDPQKLYENPNAMDLKLNNRYTNVLPYANKRVMLKQKGQDLTSNYINASPIMALLTGAQRGYIGAQAPIPPTFPEWWRMIWEQQCDIVLMLTNTIESERLKAHKYWPDVGASIAYGDIRVTAKTSTEDGDLFCRTYTILNLAEPKVTERSVTHIQFVGWPDHGVPKSLDTFVNLFTTYRSIRDHAQMEGIREQSQNPGPVLVHCSAGIGRTGTFIALDQLLDNLQTERVRDGKTSPSVNVYAITKHMREQRPGMIQTKEQYVFCSVFLDHCLHNRVLGLSYPVETKPAPRVSVNTAAVTPRVSMSTTATSRASASSCSCSSSTSSSIPPPSPCSSAASAPSSSLSGNFLSPNSSASPSASPGFSNSPRSRTSTSSSPPRARAVSAGNKK